MLDLTGIHLRLKQARKKKYDSATAFARSIGVPEVSYRAKERGTRPITPGDAETFALALGVKPEWLLLGEKSVDQEQSEVLSHAVPVPVPVPVLTWTEAEVVFSMGGIDVKSLAKSRLSIDIQGKSIIAFRAEADYTREVLAGSAVCVDTEDKEPRDGRLYLLLVDTSIQVRRYVDDQLGARFEAEPLGERVSPLLPAHGARVMGRIVRIIRDV